MRGQRVKDLYFTTIRPLAKVNHLKHRLRWRGSQRSDDTPLRLNLGCGPKYLPGFVNIDGAPNYRKDMWLDVRNGLPFPDDSVDLVYASHVLEHFYVEEARTLLGECWRVLQPERGIRILVPSVEKAIQAYVEQMPSWFGDFPHSFESLGGRLSNFLVCDGQHRLVFDRTFLDELLRDAGFDQVETRQPRESDFVAPGELAYMEKPEEDGFWEMSLICEARKPPPEVTTP